MPISREDLLKKGWTDEEVDYTFNVIDTAKDKKSAFIHFLDGAISWFGLFIVFLGSLILSVVLMPFFLTVKGPFLYLMVFMIAFVLGIVFNFLLDQINQLGKQEKIVGEIFLPVISMIDVYVMFGITNVLIDSLKMNYEPHNQFLFGLVYVISLSSPFYISHSKMIFNKYLLRFFSGSHNTKKIQQVQMRRGNSPVGSASQNSGYAQNPDQNAPVGIQGMQNVQNAQNAQQDYYEAYLEEQKRINARKMLYEQKLKEKLLSRLNR